MQAIMRESNIPSLVNTSTSIQHNLCFWRPSDIVDAGFSSHCMSATYINQSGPFPTTSTKGLLNGLHFAQLEAFLSARTVEFGSRTALSRDFAFGSVLNMLCSTPTVASHPVLHAQTILKRLSTFLPKDKGAVILIGEKDMTETNWIRLLLFAMANGFAGLDSIPIENMLSVLGRFEIVTSSLLRLLLDGPRHISRTLADNVFRAAIEAKDHKVVRLLLEHGLVNVNDTVCSPDGVRYTPVERAAFLRDCDIVRMLVKHGASVNKTFAKSPSHGGALNRLLQFLRDNTTTLEMVDMIDFMIENGAKVSVNMLTLTTSGEVTYKLLSAIPPSDHHHFFEDQIVSTVEANTDVIALAIIDNMIQTCKATHGGDCLARFPKAIESAVIKGVEKGNLNPLNLSLTMFSH